jgi:hypothetical protein
MFFLGIFFSSRRKRRKKKNHREEKKCREGKELSFKLLFYPHFWFLLLPSHFCPFVSNVFS